ncbi:MAG: cytidine deaminase [Fuerstiella sp.]|nr:cytidine deaminase [Fuerstiella sp.]
MNKNLPLPDDWKRLVKAAREVRCRAYAPYSSYTVGAALRTADGRVFTGCNVENASYGLTICAERVAMCSAVAAGASQPLVICVTVTGPPALCGSCRQFLNEFNPDLCILLDDSTTDCPPEYMVLKDLLPHAFFLKPAGH